MGMIKAEREKRLIKKAAAISNACIKIIEKSLREDITERELARRVRREINRRGGTLSFQTLVGTGKRSRMIHTKPRVTDRKISGLGYIDFGARYKGYVSDVTVPFIKGPTSKQERRVVNLVFSAYKLAVRSVRVEEPCWKLFYKVDRYFRRYGFKMQHGLGHGVGLKVHEMPIIAMPRKLVGAASLISSEKKLTGKKLRRWKRIKKITFQPGMIFTIEPAIYTKKFGCRIENDFLLERNKLVKLTNAELIIVK